MCVGVWDMREAAENRSDNFSCQQDYHMTYHSVLLTYERVNMWWTCCVVSGCAIASHKPETNPSVRFPGCEMWDETNVTILVFRFASKLCVNCSFSNSCKGHSIKWGLRESHLDFGDLVQTLVLLVLPSSITDGRSEPRCLRLYSKTNTKTVKTSRWFV